MEGSCPWPAVRCVAGERKKTFCFRIGCERAVNTKLFQVVTDHWRWRFPVQRSLLNASARVSRTVRIRLSPWSCAARSIQTPSPQIPVTRLHVLALYFQFNLLKPTGHVMHQPV